MSETEPHGDDEALEKQNREISDGITLPGSKVKGRITFSKNPFRVFGVLFNHGMPMELSLTRYCFQGCPFAFDGESEIWVRQGGRIFLAKLNSLSAGLGVTEIEGLEFLSIDNDGKQCWVPSQGITAFPMEERRWFKFRLESGGSFTVTNDHEVEIWTRDGWTRTRAENLKKGDAIPFVRTIKDAGITTNPTPIVGTSLDTAFVAGVILGDGCLSNNSNLRSLWLTCSLNFTTKDWIARRMESLGCKTKVHTNPSVQTIQIPWRTRWQDWLGTSLAPEKEIPADIFGADDAHVIEFLKGLFYTDGHLNRARSHWSFFSTSKTLVDGAQFLLARLGIPTSRYFQKARGHSRACYHVKVTGEYFKIFANLMGEQVDKSDRSELMGVPYSMLDGKRGVWLAANLANGKMSRFNEREYPGEFATKMLAGDAWCARVQEIESFAAASPQELAYCPLQNTTERVTLSDLTVMRRCFATTNKRANNDVIGTLEDPTDMVIRKIQKANGQGYESTDLLEWCLHHKYPIIFSNNVDPFMPASEAGWKLGERILRACLEHRQPLFIQTKEVYTRNVRDLIIEGRDIFNLYVSISTLDFETAKRYETVTPPPAERFRRIRDLVDHGVKVCVALNPYVPEWQPDLRAYFQAVKDSGARGVFTYPLHFTEKQKRFVPNSFGAFKGEKCNRYLEFYDDTRLMETLAQEMGLGLHYPRRVPNDFYDGNAAGLKLWPIEAQPVVEMCHRVWRSEKLPVKLTWADVDAYYARFPEWDQIFKIGCFAGILWYDTATYNSVRAALGGKNRLKNIVRYIFNHPEQQDHFLSFYYDFFPLVDSQGCEANEVDYIEDDQGDLVWIYDPGHRQDGFHWDQADPNAPDLVELE